MTPTERLIAAAEEALEFLDDQADVADGDYGEPIPNRAMILATELRSAIADLENPR